MRQEPSEEKLRWLIIGPGRLGRTLQHQLQELGQIVNVVRSNESASDMEPLSDRVLVCVPDSKISSVLDRKSGSMPWIHFSATVKDERAYRLHPMRSFDGRPLSLDEFSNIPFAKDLGSPSLQELLPPFNNPSFELTESEFQRYHALCVLAASFPVLLWSLIEKEFAALGVNPNFFREYTQAVSRNFHNRGADALTGPWIRNDLKTIERNVAALEGASQSLVDFYLSGLNIFRTLPSKNERSPDVVP